MFAEEEQFRRVRDLLPARLGQLSLPLVAPRLVVFDEAVDDVVLEQLQVGMFPERGLRVREDLQVEREDRAAQRILRGRRGGHVPSRDRSEPGTLDRNRGRSAFVRAALAGSDSISLHHALSVLVREYAS